MPVRTRSKLHDTLVQLASDFADGVLEALRNVSLEDLLAEAGASRAVAERPVAAEPATRKARKSHRRLARRSPADIGRVVERVVALLTQHPQGLRSEEIQKELGLASKEMPRPLADALAAHRITRRGEKRATTYLLGKGAATARTATRTAKASHMKKKPAPVAARGKAPTKAPAKKAPKAAKKAKAASVPAKAAQNGAHATRSAGPAGAPN